MKNIQLLLVVIIFFMSSCSENIFKEDSIQEGAVESAMLKSVFQTTGPNENILAKSLILNNWRTAVELYPMSYNDMRNTLIVEMSNRTSDPVSFIQQLSDYDLSYVSLMYRFLLGSEIKTETELAAMSVDNFRNTIIAANNNNTSYTISVLQGFDNAKNLQIAYNWWLSISCYNEIAGLNNANLNNAFFDLKDDQNRSIEVLRVVKADEPDYTYLGVYHGMIGSNHFNLYLAGSNDLQNWTYIKTLGDRAHQGDIEKWGNGYLLVNEQDVIEGANYIQVRYYTSYQNLKNNIPLSNVTLPHLFAPSAEGTPDIRQITGSTPDNSRIYLGFHFYDNNNVDLQAFGVLDNFDDFRGWKDEIANYNVTAMGFAGNIGARSSFYSGENQYVILEAQTQKYTWEGWRLLLGDGGFYTQLNLQTPKGSTSFANPGIADFGNGNFGVTSYLPTEGNQIGEIGQMLYTVNFN
ncbi:hypothetical protein SAMN06265379_11236 [Saccharicrinis carchari]|uniref:Uncharacterized protein n=1 Tax=Saccharicrinis carchari TaxID=1168039 RepID=A0A521EZ11_SACCC|nr:hypothetical protein [Saccharicrinis carchari]SMO89252.1 hypothetical protein SAMN06265379_11236 [Saccharicrinis carchari]